MNYEDHLDEDTPYAGDEMQAGSPLEFIKSQFAQRESRQHILSIFRNIIGFALVTSLFAKNGDKVSTVADLIKLFFGED
ncbi:hypothetical protein PPL_12244 [Heterostelium album PN500]|uniref:Uncharacterized protein n=1 Tax=Heterostelium pallidum (strain ATCC 26659 / Pp 5 / PN500) TaxID=670386 RepID=D3BM36_HETP5|nr:hypothetical protein PPL_12244 [Heterostelium album PN500]EFA77637.1 hypothetical protein PPL_12244 [Heterostelium album PN500]|eukprot:XP_020429765.1 hypothetical protein PPL_12244 [Heterostelium album PN500]